MPLKDPNRTWSQQNICGFLLLGQQVVSQLLVLKVIVLHPLLGARLRPLHLRPQRVHVGGVCTRGTEVVRWW